MRGASCGGAADEKISAQPLAPRLNGLIAKCFQAYDDYEFNAVTHAINDFCVVEMSNFYLDIIKDRGKTHNSKNTISAKGLSRSYAP